MIKTGVTEREARSIVRKHIDSTMNGLAAHVSGNAGKTGNPGDPKATADQHRVIQPLLNKLTDVTLTKCPEQMQHMQQVIAQTYIYDDLDFCWFILFCHQFLSF